MKKSFTDQLGNQMLVNFPPKRIISLVPSQTELLFDLGLDEEVIGVTKFCIHPIEKFAERTKVGGTKQLNLALIESLKPDLIIANKEENTKAEIEHLQKRFPVWVSDVNTLAGAQQMIADVGKLVDRVPEASYLNFLINAGFRDLQVLAAEKQIKAKVAYIIWKDPFMFAGSGTFIDDVLRQVGLINVVKLDRYPEISLVDLKSLNPEYVLLSSEPYPFKEKHLAEIQNELPNAKIMLVDGEMFSWHGSRLVKAVQYFFEFQNNFS